MQNETADLVVDPKEAGWRLDAWLVARVEGLSRARARTMVEAGQVRVNGRRAPKGQPLAAGDVVRLVAPPPPAHFSPVPEPSLPLVLVHVDEHVVVVDKPAGMACHPLRHDELGTVANGLVARFPETAAVGHAEREPGIVHRLDTATSGLLLVARTRVAFDSLTRALRAGEIEKDYRALVAGVLPDDDGSIDIPLAPHPKDRRRVLACVHPRDAARLGARPATTRYHVERRLGAHTLLCATATSAYRHQIRAHFEAIEHPLAGDELYGGPPVAGLSRQFLHASRLAFAHPVTNARLELHSELPPELQAALATLERSVESG